MGFLQPWGDSVPMSEQGCASATGELSLFLFFFIPILVLLILISLAFIILTVTLTVHFMKLTNSTLSRPIPCPCRVPGTHRKICNRKVFKDFLIIFIIRYSIVLLIISSTNLIIFHYRFAARVLCVSATARRRTTASP